MTTEGVENLIIADAASRKIKVLLQNNERVKSRCGRIKRVVGDRSAGGGGIGLFGDTDGGVADASQRDDASGSGDAG
jgi:hypothetical protein